MGEPWGRHPVVVLAQLLLRMGWVAATGCGSFQCCHAHRPAALTLLLLLLLVCLQGCTVKRHLALLARAAVVGRALYSWLLLLLSAASSMGSSCLSAGQRP